MPATTAPATYPNPDPMLRFIPQEEAPAAFWRMPPQMRSKRARLYIICRCAGVDALVAWHLTMLTSPENNKYVDEIVGDHTDAAIEDAIRRDWPATD
jgi:hypothetical protein